MMNKRTAGFTLVEVVISLALGGLILMSVMSLFVGIFQTWNAKKTPYESFIDHVDNCTRFLQNQLNSVVPVVSKNQVFPNRYHCIKIKNKTLRTPSNWCLGILTTNPLPFFQVKGGCLMWQALVFSDKGLGFIFEHLEVVDKRMADGVEETGKTVIEFFQLSPYVTEMTYGYYDPEKGNWEFIASLEEYCTRYGKNNFKQRPDGIRLVFKKEDWEVERFIALNNNYFIEMNNSPKETKKKENEKQK